MSAGSYATPSYATPSYAAVVYPAVTSSAFERRSSGSSLDVRILRRIYHSSSPVFAGSMRLADRSAWLGFIGLPAGAWGVAAAGGDGFRRAYILTLSELLAASVTGAIKVSVRRDRPYDTYEDIRRRNGREGAVRDPHSFPSGHTAIAVAVLSTAALDGWGWKATVPLAVWATAVGASRIWLGAHYPSDVLAGAAIGLAASLVVHWLGDAIVPSSFRSSEGSSPLSISVSLAMAPL